MIDLINALFYCVGMCFCGFIALGLISILLEKICDKIKELKDRKTVIEKGTIFFLDGKRVVLKEDLELRFKKVKYTECVCDKYWEIPVGIQRGTGTKSHRRWAKTNFETNLLNMYKDFPDKFENILEYQNNKGE